MKSSTIEETLVGYSGPFSYQKWLVVPNVSYGLNLHECDVLALTRSGYAHEIEIKVSKADLKKDLLKPHGHRSQKIKCLWFCGPAELKEAFEEICPERAGIILIHEPRTTGGNHRAVIHRKALPNTSARKFTAEERLKMAELGTMRYWSRRV